MTTIFERVVTALSGLSIPVSNQVQIAASGTALPDKFAVFSLVTAPPEGHADNAETLRSYQVQVNYFDRDGLNSLPDIDTPMVAAGFRKGPKFQLPYSQETQHFGFAQNYVILLEEN